MRQIFLNPFVINQTQENILKCVSLECKESYFHGAANCLRWCFVIKMLIHNKCNGVQSSVSHIHLHIIC